jgi:hypothetical protein
LSDNGGYVADNTHHLRVTVFNSNQLPAEDPQTCSGAILASTTASEVQGQQQQVWLWLDTVHMQIPLDNLETGAYMVVEWLKSSGDTAAAAVVASARINVDRAVVTSQLLSLPLQQQQQPQTQQQLSPLATALNVEMLVSQRSATDGGQAAI